MNKFWINFIVGTLLLFQGIQAQIRILLTAGENSHGEEKRHITLRCRVSDMTDVHIKCQDLWWTREIDHFVHREVVIGRKKYDKAFQTEMKGYQAELKVPPPREESREVYSCHVLCGLQTFTATCHLKDIKNSLIECSSHFMSSYRKVKFRNEKDEILEMKTTLGIGTPIFGIMLISLLIMGGRKIWKLYKSRKAPGAEIFKIIDKEDPGDGSNDKDPNDEDPKETVNTDEKFMHNRPSIMLNGELILDGNTPFAKVSYKSNNKPIVSHVQDMDALQNWDPGVSCFTLAESDVDSQFEEENSDAEKLLVPDNDCYGRDRSASCP